MQFQRGLHPRHPGAPGADRLLNYAYGLTDVSFRHYVLASWAAMLPGTIAYAWIGAAGAAVASSAAGGGSWLHTALQVLGVAATLGVAVPVGRIATRALRAEVRDGDTPGGGEAA